MLAITAETAIVGQMPTAKFARCLLEWIVLFSAALQTASATILAPPRNTVSLLGTRTVLECNVSSDGQPAWQFTNVQESLQAPVYNYNDGLNPEYAKYNISVEQHVNVVFGSVRQEDTGTYTCQDVQSTGAARLAVIDNEPTCNYTSVAGSSSSSGAINVTCSVTIYGPIDSPSNRLEPALDWINCGSIISNDTTSSQVDPAADLPSHHLRYTAWAELSSRPTSSCKIQLSFHIQAVERVDTRDPVFNRSWSVAVAETTPATPPGRDNSSSGEVRSKGIQLTTDTVTCLLLTVASALPCTWLALATLNI